MYGHKVRMEDTQEYNYPSSIVLHAHAVLTRLIISLMLFIMLVMNSVFF